MSSRGLASAVGWVGIAVCFYLLLRIGGTGAPQWLIALAALLVLVAVTISFRSLAGLTQLQTLLGEGRAKPMLRITKRRLRYRGGGNDRVPLLIYRAAAMSLLGRFREGLKVLEVIEIPSDLPEEDRDSWLFSYASTLFSCQLFAEEIADARSTFESYIAPQREIAALETTISAMEAELHYCEGEHIKAERIFEKLTDDGYTPPAARSVFHYFLGRIYFDRGQSERATEQFDEARRLGAGTWIPAGIDALVS